MKNIAIKIIEFVKRNDNIFFIILIFLSMSGITLNIFITNSDELWNFQNVYKMHNGYQIYQDANVIVTPLFFWIGECLFKILGANFLTFRIYNIITLIPLYFISYLILKKIKVNKKISVILILTLIILNNYCIVKSQANYNNLALVLVFLGIYLYLKRYKYNFIIQGLIVFLIFMTKQNLGAYYAIGLFFCEMLEHKYWKEKVRNLVVELFIFIFFLSIFLMYLYYEENLYNFINYTILGIGEFAVKNIFINSINVFCIIFFVIINIVLTFVFIKNKKVNKEQKNTLLVLNCFAILFTLVVIPICNDVHFLQGIYLSIILFVYLVSILIKEIELKINQKIINVALLILIFFICGNSIYNLISWHQTVNSENYKIEKGHPFYGGVYYEEDLIENINNITNYIKNSQNKVIVLSSKAAYYMIPTKNNNGALDLPFKGNFGKDGEEGIIKQIEEMQKEKVEILIEKDENNMIYQESKMVREYIIQNMDKIGEIEEFDIYK